MRFYNFNPTVENKEGDEKDDPRLKIYPARQLPTTFKEQLDDLCKMQKFKELLGSEKVEKLKVDYAAGKIIDLSKALVNLYKNFSTGGDECTITCGSDGQEDVIKRAPPKKGPNSDSSDTAQDASSSASTSGSGSLSSNDCPSSNVSPSSSGYASKFSPQTPQPHVSVDCHSRFNFESDNGHDTVSDIESEDGNDSEMSVDEEELNAETTKTASPHVIDPRTDPETKSNFGSNVREDDYLDFVLRCYHGQTEQGQIEKPLNPELEYLHLIKTIAEIEQDLDDDKGQRMEED